jgi:hypothetical protein
LDRYASHRLHEFSTGRSVDAEGIGEIGQGATFSGGTVDLAALLR